MTIISCMYAITAMDVYNIVQQYKTCVFNFIIHITVIISHLATNNFKSRYCPDSSSSRPPATKISPLGRAAQAQGKSVLTLIHFLLLGWQRWIAELLQPPTVSRAPYIIEQGYSHLASTSTVGVTSILPVTSNHTNNNNICYMKVTYIIILYLFNMLPLYQLCWFFLSYYPYQPCVYTFLYCHPYFTHSIVFYACIINL